MVRPPHALLLGLALCGLARAQQTWDLDSLSALDSARCLACHGDGAELASPPLRLRPRAFAQSWLESFLPTHQRLGAADARDLSAFLGASDAASPRISRVAAGEIERGERIWRESGCVACHDPDGIDGLAKKTWIPAVDEFLRSKPDAMVPSHAFGFSDDETRALAAFLLRDQATAKQSTATPGLQVECFELPIKDGGLPELAGLQPKQVGSATRIDVTPRTRDDNFALRFTGYLDVPRDGEWRFWTGSDDSSWLWIDDQLVVRNEGLAPHRRRDGRIALTAGAHRIRVVYTEAGGGQSLEVLWRGPGTPQEELPARVLASEFVEFHGPDPASQGDADAILRGKRVFESRRCSACHAGEGVQAPPAKRWSALRAGADCTLAVVPAALRTRVGTAVVLPTTANARLALALRRDACTTCHGYEGSAGLRPAARALLVEREDLGEEGRVPPDLTDAGHRLRPLWTHDVLTGSRRARPYLAVRMPAYDEQTASRYAAMFAACGADEVDVEPVVDAKTVAEGRSLAGSNVGGYACIACHRVAGQKSLGPQGMDLSLQIGRLRPNWIREWIKAPSSQRPGTRMPTFFPDDSPATRQKIDALVSWLSLGATMPLPDGVVATAGQWRLAVGDRPRIHGAFLKGLSARCIAVATPERVNWAYDLAHARLAWIWRGEFLDTSGTWDGRAGQLLEPLGQGWIVLPQDSDGFRLLDGREATPRMLGWRVAVDGNPVMRMQVGPATIEDAPRAVYAAGGAVLVRRITVKGADVRLPLPQGGGYASEPSDALVIHDGETKEVTYRW